MSTSRSRSRTRKTNIYNLPRISSSPKYFNTSETELQKLFETLPQNKETKKGRGRPKKITSQNLNERLHKLKHGDDTLSDRLRKLISDNQQHKSEIVEFTEKQLDDYLNEFIDTKLEKRIKTIEKKVEKCCAHKKSPKKQNKKPSDTS
jgi:predicted CopG family antitoxin